ncbi:MAG: class I SAM-dependent methyltransferase [Bacteroides sp.]|nr:class I SAM-dependent methyltransferase [Bacteroides sp.]
MKDLLPETLEFIAEHLHDDVRSLALQAKKYPLVDMHAAVIQIAGRQSIIHKLPSWYNTEGLLYPPHLSLEQCSSETTALYKSSLLQGNSLVDLTGGFGVDCAFLSKGFKQVTYVERQQELADIVRHNFQALGLSHIQVHQQDGVGYLEKMEPVDCIFMDPARRNQHGGKVVALSDCEPNVEELQELLLQKAEKVLIKLSPMLDLSLALRNLHNISEIHVVSIQNECKELLLLLQRKQTERVMIHCLNFTTGGKQVFSFYKEEETDSPCTYTHELGQYLYEPNASLLKSGAYKCLAERFTVFKLHPNSHLYTSDTLIDNFPGRSFKITASGSLKDKTLLPDNKQANLTTRNFPLSTAEVRKRLKLKEGGTDYLFATTLMNGKHILIRGRKV